MNDDARDVLARMALAAGRLDTLISGLQEQARTAQAAMQATREQEEARFKQAMVAQFQDQQQRLEAALRSRVAWAWKMIVAVAGFAVLLLAGYWLLLKQADARLRAAQARADAIEVKADVLDASRHVEITTCGGRPCIRIDRDTPTWKGKGGEYVLVDAPAR
ncbi:MAG TPA: hypothetical protein VEY92_08905 [Pseudoxanthomonas sp.]|nr:hypothetical protein [Pseudoxanthomonas sp.]